MPQKPPPPPIPAPPREVGQSTVFPSTRWCVSFLIVVCLVAAGFVAGALYVAGWAC